MSSNRLLRTAQAEEDLIEIWRHIALDSVRAADRLDEKSRMLAGNPRLGAERADIAAGVRSWPVGSYLILYRELDNGVEVVRYAHGARRLRDLA